MSMLECLMIQWSVLISYKSVIVVCQIVLILVVAAGSLAPNQRGFFGSSLGFFLQLGIIKKYPGFLMCSSIVWKCRRKNVASPPTDVIPLSRVNSWQISIDMESHGFPVQKMIYLNHVSVPWILIDFLLYPTFIWTPTMVASTNTPGFETRWRFLGPPWCFSHGPWPWWPWPPDPRYWSMWVGALEMRRPC